MKKLILALALALSANTYALDVDRSTGGMFYVSSYSNAALFYNMDAGQRVNIYAYGSPTVFCGASNFSNSGDLLVSGWGDSRGFSFTAWNKGLYAILCIKRAGISDDVILVIEDTVKRGIKQNEIYGDDESLDLLQDAFNDIGE